MAICCIGSGDCDGSGVGSRRFGIGGKEVVGSVLGGFSSIATVWAVTVKSIVFAFLRLG